MQGFVSNIEKTNCIPCMKNQIVIMGQCQNCTNHGEIPTMDRLRCVLCPNNLVSEDGTCIMN